MSKPYSEDLRERVVAAVEGGLSRRQAAEVFDVGVSSVIRWVQRFRATGSVAAKPMGGARGVIVGYGTVWRFFEREDITFKKKRAGGRTRAA